MEEPSPQSRQETLDRQTEEFEAKGGKVTHYRTKETGEIIQCMREEAQGSLWNSSEIADLEERKRMKGDKK